MSTFERDMEAKVMSLGNEIASLTIECDRVDSEKSALQNDEEETSAKNRGQVSELSQVIFAIEMIENLCSTKRTTANGVVTHETHLQYAREKLSNEGKFNEFGDCEKTSID